MPISNTEAVANMSVEQPEWRRKCFLVLDLDHTLVHTIPLSSLRQPSREQPEDPKDQEDHIGHANHTSHSNHTSHTSHTISPVPYQSRDVFYIDDQFLVHVRPQVLAALRIWSQHFELLVYTHGTYTYAMAVLKHLDPSGELFDMTPVVTNSTSSATPYTTTSTTSYQFNSLHATPQATPRCLLATPDELFVLDPDYIPPEKSLSHLFAQYYGDNSSAMHHQSVPVLILDDNREAWVKQDWPYIFQVNAFVDWWHYSKYPVRVAPYLMEHESQSQYARTDLLHLV